VLHNAATSSLTWLLLLLLTLLLLLPPSDEQAVAPVATSLLTWLLLHCCCCCCCQMNNPWHLWQLWRPDVRLQRCCLAKHNAIMDAKMDRLMAHPPPDFTIAGEALLSPSLFFCKFLLS
jgi:hypothetical protein